MSKQTIVFGTLMLLMVESWVQSLNAQSRPSEKTLTSSISMSPAVAPDNVLTVPAGESLILQLETSLHTGSTREGDRVSFLTEREVRVGDKVAIPSGSSLRATVTKVQRPGRLKGRAEIRLRFEEVMLAEGTTLPLNASIVSAGFTRVSNTNKGDLTLKGEGGNRGSPVVVAQGGLQGAVLGAVFGGAKGAAFGGALGAGIGLASVILQRGPDLDLARDMLFEVKVNQAFNVPGTAAERALQLARSRPSTSSAPTGGAGFPGEPAAEDNAGPVPDFSQDREARNESTEPSTVATTRGPIPPPSGPPPSPPVWEDPDPGGFKLKVDVQLVMVDAMVRDRTGWPFDNLKQDDFRIFEDGVEQKIQSFSRDELPLAVALVVDRSGSVAPFMNELRHAAYQALSQLKRGDQVALFAFAGEVQRLENLTTNRQRIADRIAQIRAGGGTNIIDALFDAVYYLSSVARDRRRAVILISDNVATTKPRASQGQTIRLAMESETVVYSVKTPGEGIPLTMRVPVWLGGNGSVSKVTQETGGEIIDVEHVGSLDAALATAISRLKLRYTLGYQSSKNLRDGAFRKIEVQLSERFGRLDRDYSIHARRGYYSPAEKVAARSSGGPRKAED